MKQNRHGFSVSHVTRPVRKMKNEVAINKLIKIEFFEGLESVFFYFFKYKSVQLYATFETKRRE